MRPYILNPDILRVNFILPTPPQESWLAQNATWWGIISPVAQMNGLVYNVQMILNLNQRECSTVKIKDTQLNIEVQIV